VVVIHKKAGRALKRSAKGKAHGVKLKAELLKWQDRFGGERGFSSDGYGVTPAAESHACVP